MLHGGEDLGRGDAENNSKKTADRAERDGFDQELGEDVATVCADMPSSAAACA